MIVLKKIINSCRYDQRLLIMMALLVIGVIALLMEGMIYVRNTEKIDQLKIQSQRQEGSIQTKDAAGKNVKTKAIRARELKLDGIILENGVLYAIFNGRPFQPTERIAHKWEVLEITRYKVLVKNLENDETIVFALINPSAIPKSPEVPIKALSSPVK
jgi:hypothetical protein